MLFRCMYVCMITGVSSCSAAWAELGFKLRFHHRACTHSISELIHWLGLILLAPLAVSEVLCTTSGASGA